MRGIPDPGGKCVRGRPLQRTWNLFTSPDERCFTGAWEAEPGCWRIGYTEHEYCRIQSGHSILRDATGAEKPLQSGKEFLIPAGFDGRVGGAGDHAQGLRDLSALNG